MISRDRASAILRAAPDAALGLLGAAFGAITWWFPFSRDQAVFYYVGREWFERGAIPYRDVVEQKTPFIFFVNGVLERVFGESAAPIHFVEWLAVLATGVLAVLVAKPARAAAPPGAYGAGILVASVFFFGFFTFRELANCEPWVVLFTVASLLAARSIRRPFRAAVAAGLLAGLAIQAKPPALLLAPLPAYELLARVWVARDGRPRRAALTLAAFGAGLLAPNLLVLLYFGAHGALAPMFDLVVRMNAFNSEHLVPAHTFMEWYRALLGGFHWFQPYGELVFTTLFVGVAVAALRGNRALVARYARPAVVLVLAYAVSLSQLKLLLYHFETLLLPVALLGALLYEDLYATAASKTARSAVAPVFAVALVGAYFLSGFAKDEYLSEFKHVREYLFEGASRFDFVSSFKGDGLDLAASQLTGEWIASHSRPDDGVLVRGYECQIYFFARRRYTGRFEHSLFQTHPWLAWRRDYYLAEDYRDIVTHRPRFVVTLRESPYPIERPEWFESRGYERRASFGWFDVLELIDPSALASTPTSGSEPAALARPR